MTSDKNTPRLSVHAFRSNWYFGLIFFGIHLGLLGYLLTNLKPFLFPDLNLNFAEYTFYGELIFMLWLLISGSRLQESN